MYLYIWGFRYSNFLHCKRSVDFPTANILSHKRIVSVCHDQNPTQLVDRFEEFQDLDTKLQIDDKGSIKNQQNMSVFKQIHYTCQGKWVSCAHQIYKLCSYHSLRMLFVGRKCLGDTRRALRID